LTIRKAVISAILLPEPFDFCRCEQKRNAEHPTDGRARVSNLEIAEGAEKIRCGVDLILQP
jgi:hypothetical protein